MFDIVKTLNACCDGLGYEIHEARESEWIICEINPAATAAAEIAEKPDVAQRIIQYNHFMLKGEIEKKRDILRALASEIEPQQNQIKSLDKDLGVALFDLLNGMHIRHNNKDPKKKSYYRQHVVDMTDDELEEWYDEIYQMILLAMLLMDHNKERKDKVAQLRASLAKKS